LFRILLLKPRDQARREQVRRCKHGTHPWRFFCTSEPLARTISPIFTWALVKFMVWPLNTVIWFQTVFSTRSPSFYRISQWRWTV
jgi:hypothetical protein